SEFTFGELPAETKNAISHRSHAVWKLARFLAERE
ncbi:MAG: non-canonical purine NTP pyrophosphatase, partial [Flavobacteriales bacterium]|nr:non-canonical purine NTP pyrophosphatase [Flavobacteriales bacterium]